MSKGIMTVLGHQVEYDSGNIILDQEAEDILSDTIADTIEITEKLADTEELWLELDGSDFAEQVTVTWKVVNTEADKWREIAGNLYRITKLQTNQSNVLTDERVRVANEIMEEYEQLIQEENERD